jgi:hypothetical protein
MFGDINVNACEDCPSLTGRAAYFLGLLRMLKNGICNPTVPRSATLLCKLLERRSDLRNSKPSCPSVNILLLYVDIVNEIAESFISNLPQTSTTNTEQQPLFSRGRTVKVEAISIYI